MKRQPNHYLWRFLSAIAFTLFLPMAAQAHPGHGEGGMGWLVGLAHPFNGLDHILAMVAVGLWAAQLGGRAIWAMPLTFVGMMAVSATIGATVGPIPGVESGIILSDLILGGLVLAAMRLPIGFGMTIIAVLASFHGYAHGVEMPQTGSGLAYGLGFVIATAILHTIGLGLAFLVKTPAAIRLAGGAIALAGGYLLLQSVIGV
jgi:urease accessory protein